jgi:transposase-like protein
MRRKREEWPKLVARWEASGESAAVFARHVGVNAMTLYRWRRELRSAGSGPALSKIVEIRLGDGLSVEVPPSSDAGALERLLRVLEAAR